MEESREETPTTTLEEKTIKKGKPFTFFSNEATANPDELTETRQVEGVGPLRGTASVHQLNGQNKWVIGFSIKIPSPKVKETTNQPIEGQPGENLVMFAYLKSSSDDVDQQLKTSVGRPQDKGGQQFLIFDEWYSINEHASKTQIMSLAQTRRGNPLTAPDGSYIRYSQFKLI